ncbi:hypothetical protein ACKU3U_028155 [Pseudomonas aeruginosa]
MKIKLGNQAWKFLMKDSGINTFEEMAQRLTENQGWPITRNRPQSENFPDPTDVSLSL